MSRHPATEESFGIAKDGRANIEVLRISSTGEVTVRTFTGTYVVVEVAPEELAALREAADLGEALMVFAGMLARRAGRGAN